MALKHKEKLNPKQEKFCRLYASDKEFFGNGVESYLEAYKMPQSKYKSAGASSGRLLENVKILDRINELLDIAINDAVVDKELGFTIIQKRDLSSKVQAIKEYNRVKKRVEDTPRIVFNIGSLLTKIEQTNDSRTETTRQELPTPNLLLDKEQTRESSVIQKKQSPAGLPTKKT